MKATCECGNPASVHKWGRNMICERCDQIEKSLATEHRAEANRQRLSTGTSEASQHRWPRSRARLWANQLETI